MKKIYIQPVIEFEPLENLMDGPVTASAPKGNVTANGYDVHQTGNGGDNQEGAGLNGLDLSFE